MNAQTIDIAHVAKLARIALTDDEAARLGPQLEALLGQVAILARLPLDDVAATAQVVELRNVTRADEARPSLDRETVLAGAPQRQGAYVRVPRILAEDA